MYPCWNTNIFGVDFGTFFKCSNTGTSLYIQLAVKLMKMFSFKITYYLMCLFDDLNI